MELNDSSMYRSAHSETKFGKTPDDLLAIGARTYEKVQKTNMNK